MSNSDEPSKLEETLLAKAKILMEKLPDFVQTALSHPFSASESSYLILPDNLPPAIARLALIIFDLDQALCADLRQVKIPNPAGTLTKQNGLLAGSKHRVAAYFIKKICYHTKDIASAAKIWDEIVDMITKGDTTVTLGKIGSAIFDFETDTKRALNLKNCGS